MLKVNLLKLTHTLLLGLGFTFILTTYHISAQTRPDFRNFTYPNQGEQCELTNIQVRDGRFFIQGHPQYGNCLFEVNSIQIIRHQEQTQAYVVETASFAGGSGYDIQVYAFNPQGQLITQFSPHSQDRRQFLEAAMVRGRDLYIFHSRPRYGEQLSCESNSFLQFDQVEVSKFQVQGQILTPLGIMTMSSRFLCEGARGQFQGF